MAADDEGSVPDFVSRFVSFSKGDLLKLADALKQGDASSAKVIFANLTDSPVVQHIAKLVRSSPSAKNDFSTAVTASMSPATFTVKEAIGALLVTIGSVMIGEGFLVAVGVLLVFIGLGMVAKYLWTLATEKVDLLVQMVTAI